MTGLFIKELILRGDLQRCLIVAPGNLTEQWQDELWQKFQLPFDLLTNDKIEAARSGNALAEIPMVIARLDKLSRNEDIQARLAQTDWDLVVVMKHTRCQPPCLAEKSNTPNGTGLDNCWPIAPGTCYF